LRSREKVRASSGIENAKKKFKGYFPAEAGAIDRYFDMVQSVCNRTPSLNLHANTIAPPTLTKIMSRLTRS